MGSVMKRVIAGIGGSVLAKAFKHLVEGVFREKEPTAQEHSTKKGNAECETNRSLFLGKPRLFHLDNNAVHSGEKLPESGIPNEKG